MLTTNITEYKKLAVIKPTRLTTGNTTNLTLTVLRPSQVQKKFLPDSNLEIVY